MESTIEKLNQNRLMELSEQDYENISNNTELKTLFLTKIKEGQKFSIDDAMRTLEDELVSAEYITISLDILKEEEPNDFVTFFYANPATLQEEFDPATTEVIIQYLKDNMNYVLSKMKDLDQQNGKIENQEIIDYIIENKIEQHYGSIHMDPPTPEFEELLLEALERNEYNYIYTINPKILKKCIKTNNTRAAMSGIHSDNQEEADIIFYAIENELITYNDLGYYFKSHLKKDIRLVRHQIRNHDFIYIDEELMEKEEVRKIILEEIEKNHELANNWHITSIAEKDPKIGLALIKYWEKDKLKTLISYNSSLVTSLLPNYKEQLIDAIIYNLEHNQSAIEEVIEYLFSSSKYHPDTGKIIVEDPRLLKYVIPKVSLEKILKYLITYEYNHKPEYYLKPNVYEILENSTISIQEIGINFSFEINYPENVWLTIIPLLNNTQLTPANIKLDRFIQYEKIFDAILFRLKELKSNVYNSSLEHWNGPKTQALIDIVLDPSNPLNLNTTQKLRILPESKLKNTKHLSEIIKQVETITTEELQLILPTILQIENNDEIKDICTILFPKVEKTQQLFSSLGGISGDIHGSIENSKDEKTNISEQHLTFYNCLKEYLKTQQDIPLTLTRHFDEDVAQLATYSNLDALVSNPNLFLVGDLAPHHFVKFIKECQNKNLPIDLKLIHQAAETSVSKKPYDYDNITFSDDKETYNILYKLLNHSPTKSPERKIVTNWINNWLNYKFFDCQLVRTNNQLLELILMHSEYTSKILEIIEPEKIKDNIVLNARLTNMLITEQDSPEQTKKVLNTIIKLIEHNKLNNFNPQYNLETYVELIDHPTFVDYVIRTYIKSIGTHMENIEILLKDKKYKEAVIKVLYNNLYLANNNYILNLIDKVPKIKEYVKYSLEQNTNDWLDFNSSYLDPELLTAFLKNHSIDKVITFIVHNQNLNIITSDIYQVIKTNLLAQHQEYTKESYDLLEQFYGYELLLLLETDNFKKLLQKDKEIVSKFIEIFKERKLDEGIIISISDSFRQNYFNIENPHIINFYTNTLEKIQRGITEEEIQEVINVLINYIPSNLEKDLEATGNELLLNTYQVNKHDFLKMLINELINNQNLYATVFNKITNNLIVQKRNEYRSTQDIYKDTNLKYEFDTRSLYNTLFNYLSKNSPEEFLDIIKNTEFDTDLNRKTILFLSGNLNEFTKNEIQQIKRNIPNFKTIIYNAFDLMNEKDKEPKERNYWEWNSVVQKQKFPNLPIRYEYLLEVPEFFKAIKKIPIYPKRKEPIEMFGNINIDVFEIIAKDEKKYQTLISLLNKYRFLEWQNLFAPTTKKLSLGDDTINIYNFINAFNKIYDNEKKIVLRERKRLMDIVVEEMKNSGKSEEEINNYIKVKEAEPININITAYKILKYSTIYSSIANYYKIILGMEDFDLVKRNDPPNSSYRSSEDRLAKATEMQLKMMELDKVTVPSFIYEHKLKSEKTKKLAVTVGNRADSRNLTHGERTGACMRAYGHADALFEFCNTDPRGFHITFTDPDTNEYVSRVSCFRNGNTVFLNQLRESVCTQKYSTQDVIEACYAVAQELIKRSKNSDMPIENVVASTGYALNGYNTQQISQNNDISNGVYNGYRDVNNFAVVLATTGKNGIAAQFKPDGENQPIYEATRLRPREYTEEQITDIIKISLQRITAIKECLENKDNPDYYKSIDFNYESLETIFVHIIIGQDWYVALDVNGNILYDIAIQNEHSIAELNNAIAKINTIKEEKIKIGGFTNGIQ